MDSRNYEQALDQAALLWGIEPDYWDIWGRHHITSPDTKRAILRALGVTSDTQEHLEAAIAGRLRDEWLRLLPPCFVQSENQQPREVSICLPDELESAGAAVEIRLENAPPESCHVNLGTLGITGSAEFDGRRFVRKSFPLPVHAPLGYHEVAIAVGDLRACMRWIIAPDRAWLPEGLRAAGVAIPLYAVRSRRNWGCGDLRDLETVVDWVADIVEASFVALNPLHAIHNRRPFNNSPYLPNSVFYHNFLYLDIESIPDFAGSPRAMRLWTKSETQRELQELRDTELVEYERLHTLKLRFLKLLFLAFLREWRQGSSRASDFNEYIDQEGELLTRYATYCALDAWIHKRHPDVWVWPDWPAEYRDPDSRSTREFQKRHWRSIMFYQYVQWQINLQLERAQQHAREKRLSIGLYHDLALATDSCGSDLWAHRTFYASGCRVGSPPDDFSPSGQDWAFPPPNSDRHWESGYRLFIESIRKNCRHGGALRIDHVMRFFRLYWIPDGVDATAGAYVRDRSEDLIRILALESVRHRVIVIGEDLGTVEPNVRQTLEQFGILSYRLLYFERDSRGEFISPDQYPEQALVSSTTHDLPTIAGFWTGEDIEARRRAGMLRDDQGYRAQLANRAVDKQRILDAMHTAGLLPDWFPRSAAETQELTGELHNAVIGFLASTPSRLLLTNQEDLTKETQQQNLPGTTSQYPNRSRKMHFRVDELFSAREALDFIGMFRAWVQKTGRSNRALE
jgi:4-alpha-glucanotransferase